ncbi:Acetyl-coenzyme A synthetase [Variovorax sp. SRS16]|uniref:acetoacetate--CoA ligase n=1 Tax=Variovorax sp. SRS16 TaxID=282217 RepID=UPI00131829F7|nr:acetoacetate--CoA ligase [Variovorax sp. SRS16]VTU15682.1 Acetyl-coenzyme A synthetase [Variovorax sp. SRS16]
MNTATDPIVWRASPERAARTHIRRFAERLEHEWKVALPDYAALHAFSIDHLDAFWRSLWHHARILGDWDEDRVLDRAECKADDRWFPGARLNYAENMLWRRDDADALVFCAEDGARRALSFRELAVQVAQAQAVFRDLGVVAGDRVVGYLPNVPEAVVAMLATTSLGAIWATVSAELSAGAVLDRLGQLEPTIFVTADGTRHAGRVHELSAKAAEVARALPSLRAAFVVGNLSATPPLWAGATDWAAALAARSETEPSFVRVAFHAPGFILFTSGTTGKPKCLTHGVGGPLIQFAKELRLHGDLRAGDRLLRLSATGWMIWNWSTAALAIGATVILYEGSATWPRIDRLFDLVERERVTFFGPSAAVLDIYAKAGLSPMHTHDLSSLRTMFAGGTRVSAANYEYVYRHIKSELYFASPSGGTDLLASFVNNDPGGAVVAGEATVATLGMAVEVLDDDGHPVVCGAGELACASSFPSMPLGFWGDADRQRLLDTYFTRYPGKWFHGDWVERTPRGGYVIHGRSDATLKARGIRIGTAEIYRPLEALPELDECAAVTQDWNGDSRIVLFVKLRAGSSYSSELGETIRTTLRDKASPHHLPAHIVPVPDLPRNGVGKVMELAIRDAIHGRVPRNVAAIANPESLAHFRDLPVLCA